MADFPDIKYLVGFKETQDKSINKQISSAGYPMVRGNATVLLKSFDLSYQNVTTDDKEILTDFFDSHQGESFNFTNPDPLRSNIFVVVFYMDKLDWNYTQGKSNPWSVNVTLKEI